MTLGGWLRAWTERKPIKWLPLVRPGYWKAVNTTMQGQPLTTMGMRPHPAYLTDEEEEKGMS